MPHCLPSDGDIRDARHRASVRWVFEWYNHRVYRVLCFQEATSRRFFLSESFFHLTSWKDAISRVMHSPMSFFETTVRTVGSAEILFPLTVVRSWLVAS
jgi:hypothetical protein